MGRRKISKKESKKRKAKKSFKTLLFWFSIALLVLLVIYLNTKGIIIRQSIFSTDKLSQESTGVGEEYIEINETELAVIKTAKPQVIVGQPVKWKKEIIPKSTGVLDLEIPEGAKNVNITKITSEKENSGVTGEVTGVSEFISKNLKDILFTVSGGVVEIKDNKVSVEVEEEGTAYYLEYETPPPQSTEIPISENKKKIIISAPDNLGYKDVLAYTELPKEASKKDVKLYHEINGIKKRVEVTEYDKNNNGLVDYIEWIVPHLSEQQYLLIIEVSKAEHLDENKEFVSDIYQQVRKKDNIWSEPIHNQEYVRVTFEQPLDNKKDITAHMRPTSTSAQIKVFIADTNILVGEFYNITQENTYKTYLTGIPENESHEMFDLLIIGEVEFDHLIDPPSECTGTANSCDTYDFSEISCGATVNDPQYGCAWVGCEGTSTSCSGLSESNCGATVDNPQYGCFWSGCTGTATDCTGIYSSTTCVSQGGCTWYGCDGNPYATPCDDFDSDYRGCDGQDGCSWDACSGTPTDCTDGSYQGESNYGLCTSAGCSNTGSSSYICYGTPNSCDTYDSSQTDCGTYGCTWDGCEGTPNSCDSYDSDQSGCTGQGGCTWTGCYGTVNSCSSYDSDQSGCTTQDGCSWEGCLGTEETCDAQISSYYCTHQLGCSWDACEGTATTCSAISNQENCDSQGGCNWEWNEDCTGEYISASGAGCGNTFEAGTAVTLTYGATCQSDPDGTFKYTNLGLYRGIIEVVCGPYYLSTGDCTSTGSSAYVANWTPGGPLSLDTAYTYDSSCYAGSIPMPICSREGTTTCTITWTDTTSPTVSITYPTSTTYDTEVTHLDYTPYDLDLSFCWYSLNGGITNISDPGCDGITGLSGTCCNDTLTWTVWAEDNSGNVGSDSVTFYSTYVTKCGSMTQEGETYTLQNNIGDSEGDDWNDCFTIGADNIDVNLGGNTVEVSSTKYGIYCSGYSGLEVTNGNLDSFDDTATSSGIYLTSCSNAIISGVDVLYNTRGIHADNSDNLTIEDVTATSLGASSVGLNFVIINDVNITNVDASGADYGIHLGTGTGNKVTSSTFSGAIDVQSSVTSNIFLDCNFDSEEGQLTRKWYYGAHVGYNNGSDASATVTALDDESSQEFQVSTDTNGDVSCLTEITDYVLSTGGVYDYSSLYTINASDGTYSDAHTYNATLEQSNCADTFTLTLDLTPPEITVDSIGGDGSEPYVTADTTPSAVLSTDEDATCRWSDIDQGYDDMIETCGVTGTQSHTCDLGAGWTPEIPQAIYFACEDAHGNSHTSGTNTETSFTIDSSSPAITVVAVGDDAFTPYSVSDTSTALTRNITTDENATCKWDSSDVSYDSMSHTCTADASGTGHACGGVGRGDSNYIDYIRCNDTLGNVNLVSTSVSYEIDSTPPAQGTHNPSSGSTINTLSPTITLETDEAAYCRASLSDESYDDMSDDFYCTGGGGTTHSCNVSGLSGSSDIVYIACSDDTDYYPNKDTSGTNTALTYNLNVFQTNITLSKGWNMVSLISDYTLDGTDRNISVEEGENIIGYSSNLSLNLSALIFINESGTIYNWSEAVAAGKVQRFLTYLENRRYKYVGFPEDGMHDYALRPNKAYKVFVNEPGNITLPGVGGSPSSGEKFNWDNMHVYKSGTVTSINDMGGTYDWLFLTGQNEFYYYTSTKDMYNTIYGGCLSPDCKTLISPWEGYFIYSNEDNVELLVNS